MNNTDAKETDGEVADLLDLDHGLTDWEVEFLDSIYKQRKDGRPFTRKQMTKVHDIYDRVL